jgi:hypothetical protein
MVSVPDFHLPIPSPISILQVNRVVAGMITKITPYGIFVNIGPETALLHISQLSSKRVEGLEDCKLFSPGMEIKVRYFLTILLFLFFHIMENKVGDFQGCSI